MPGSWFDLFNSDPAAAATYGLGPQAQSGNQPNRKGFLSGLYGLGGGLGGLLPRDMTFAQSNLYNGIGGSGDPVANRRSGANNLWDLVTGAYADKFGGSNFQNWLQNQGFNAYWDAMTQHNAAQGLSGNAMTNVDFFRQWDPVAEFNRMSPDRRGEDPRAYSPFTRFLTR